MFEATAAGAATSFLFLDNQGAQERSYASAEAQLLQILETDCDVIPCPSCGRIQEHMIPRARSQRHGWMKKTALGAFIAAGIAFLPGIVITLMKNQSADSLLVPMIWSVVGTLVAAAITLPILKYMLTKDYDPNTTAVEERIQVGREYAYTKEEFLRSEQGQ